MKFGKEFKKQMVPEWTEAYMDFKGLKKILREIILMKSSKQITPSRRPSHQRLRLHTPFSVLTPQSSNLSNNGDIEDQVIVVKLNREGSSKFYETKSLEQTEEVGEYEIMFFKKLDEELNKVNTFYKERVKAVMDEAASLDKQMDALIALRVKVDNSDDSIKTNTKFPSTTTAPIEVTSPRREYMSLASEQEIHCCQRRGNSTEGADFCSVPASKCSGAQKEAVKGNDCESDLLEILDRVKIKNTLVTPKETIKSLFNYSREEELSSGKEEVRKVEQQLKHVFIVFYQKLRLLKHYSFMNLSAFAKIMKKYEKITSRTTAKYYMKTVDDSYLGRFDELDGLLERVEATFIKHFSKLNRQKGMKSLRPKVKREKHSITFFSGFLSGCFVALLIAVVLNIETMNLIDKEEGTSYIANSFPLYSLYAYIVVHMLMYAGNIYFWRHCRVNYPFIFEFKQGTQLGYREVFLLSTGLAVVALAGFSADLHMVMDSRTEKYGRFTGLVPLGLVVVILVITFCPLNILYRSSRFFFIRCIWRCICAPLYQVTLPDFFLADNLTSQVQAIRCITLYICYYGVGEFAWRQNKCHSHSVYNAFYIIVVAIPYWIRFLQCIRRLFEEKDAVHGYNGLKYFLTIIAVVIRTAFKLRKGTTWMVLALVSSAIATIMSTYWDIVIDWGLLRWRSKNFLLRDKLVLSHNSTYFVAMILNVALRFAWIQLVLEFNLRYLDRMTTLTIVSCLEIIRRGIWNFFSLSSGSLNTFRLENEHLNNVGNFRAFKSVPLPFNYLDEEGKDD